jgi:hypothetical protein
MSSPAGRGGERVTSTHRFSNHGAPAKPFFKNRRFVKLPRVFPEHRLERGGKSRSQSGNGPDSNLTKTSSNDDET